MLNKYSKLLLLAFIILILGLVINENITGGHSEVKLSSAPFLSGVIAQNIQKSTDKKTPLKEGENFKLSNIKFFDNNTWLVVDVKINNIDKAKAVFKVNDGSYNLVLGPGTQFERTSSSSMPNDLTKYLSSGGLFYDAEL
jgi:phosphotransferase system IIB component